jgi:osmotically-inducible protein OsmY
VDEQPQYVAQRVHDALCADARLAALDLRVKVVEDQVYLQGTVATSERRALAEEIVATLLPAHRVHNDVRVLAHLDAADEEHLT